MHSLCKALVHELLSLLSIPGLPLMPADLHQLAVWPERLLAISSLSQVPRFVFGLFTPGLSNLEIHLLKSDWRRVLGVITATTFRAFSLLFRHGLRF